MYKIEVEITSETGLHARPASQFTSLASKFKSEVTVLKDAKEYNAKSIMGILSMGANKGEKITIVADGEDEKDAVEALVKLVESKFNEA